MCVCVFMCAEEIHGHSLGMIHAEDPDTGHIHRSVAYTSFQIEIRVEEHHCINGLFLERGLPLTEEAFHALGGDAT